MDNNPTIGASLILIVDDNPKNLQVLGNYLQLEGYLVEFALNGEAALDWTRRAEFDLILLDIMMPVMDGFEVCKAIKKETMNQKTPVIFLTAKIDTESIINAFDLGAVDYVIKPFNQKELIARVKTQIEIKRSRDEIAKNLKEIELKNKLITYSIEYAQRIQAAVLKASQKGSELFGEIFCLILPRDIVSGDFYWFHKIENKLLAGVFDCTGHGIPGAFMSMLGVTLLNETVIREKITRPNLILNRLREKIIEALGQKGIMSEVRDGMDGSIISYDPATRTLIYSGAFNPMYLIRGNRIIEFKADRMTLSYQDINSDFSYQEIKTLPDDLIYLSTDGFTDQFGGAEEKKFRRAQFRDVLLKNNKNTLAVQKEMLLDTYNRWKGDGEQVDDITVVGLRL
ncbi:MAG: response regulator [Bacteroidales bacterium]|jgi:CheY-like chemotaxis protein